MLRKSLPICIVAIVCLLSAACVRETRVRTIGVSQSSLDDAWRVAMVRDMQIELSNYDDLELVILDADNDSRRQAEQVEQLIDRKVDVLVVSPIESAPLTTVVEKAYRAGIPTIVTDRKVDTEEYTVFVGADNYKIGYRAGDFAVGRLARLGRRPRIAEIWGLESSSPAKERHNGFAAALSAAGIDPETDVVLGEWNYSTARARLPVLSHPERYDLVYSHNDMMAIAAREYFDRNDTLRDGRVCIVGVDAVAGAGLDAVADGRIDVSFLYPTAGAEVVRIARRLIDGEPVEKHIELVSATVDRSGAETMLVQVRRLDDYRRSIVAKKARLDEIVSQFGFLKSSLAIIVLLCVMLVGTVLIIVRANSKIRSRNRQLRETNLREEEQNRKLVALNREIEAATAQKLQFFTNVSHEVRTPLTLILGPLEKLSAALDGTVYAPDLHLMRRNGRRLLDEINRMLDFRRLESGTQELHREPTALVPFVGEIKCYFDAAARERRIDYRFENRCGESRPQLSIDRSMIEKVLVNLLSNAFKYVSDGGAVSIVVAQEHGTARMEITDNGKGIAPERLPHIFERFFTDKDRGGTGIGLHMVREFVALHGGTIRVESEPERFTRFIVELPVVEADTDAPAESDAIADTADEYLPSEEMRTAMLEALRQRYDYDILVVDDDDDMRSYIADTLSANFRVHTVENGAQALEFIASHEVSLVLSDVMMPEVNGFELCKRIKSDMRYSHIPVLLLTALNTERHALYGAATSADAYIAKPFRREYLVIRIIKLLENRRQVYRRLLEKIERHDEAAATQPIESLDDLFLRKFIALIERVYTDSEYNVERLSEEMAMSRGHLYRKVREVTGLSPVNYLCDFRLRKAKQLLELGSMSVSEVAYAMGFTSPAYFTKMFRNHFGMTPSEIKKRR